MAEAGDEASRRSSRPHGLQGKRIPVRVVGRKIIFAPGQGLVQIPSAVLGRRLPLNGAGVCGAALADLGLPIDLLRGFALLARTAGLLGQLAEERRRPIGMDVYRAVDGNARYIDPGDSES